MIILGAPGGGKGTISKKIVKQFAFNHVSTGDLLRANIQAGTELGKSAQDFMKKGTLVPDDLVVNMLKDHINKGSTDDKTGAENRLLLDGFPRTIPQAEAMLEAGVDIDYVIEIDVADDEIVKRLSGRRVHPGSGRIYHILFNQPKIEGKDDETGEDLIQRADDEEETVRKRLAIYHDQTAPLVSFYKKLREEKGDAAPQHAYIPGVGSLSEITAKVMSALS